MEQNSTVKNKPINNRLLKSSVVVMILIIIGKVLGVGRDVLVGAQFGVSTYYDMYSFALKMIYLLTALSYGLTTTLIPIQTEHINNETMEQNNKFVNNVLNVTMLITIIFSVICILFSKYIIIIFAHGFTLDPSEFTASTHIVSIMLVSLIFICAQSVITGVIQAHNKFYIPAAMTIFANAIHIVYLVFFAKYYGIVGFAVATVIGFFAQMAINIPQYKSLGYKYKFFIDFKEKEMRAMFLIMVPIIVSSSFSQLNLFVNSSIATNIGKGAPSVLDFSNKLNTLVSEVFGTAITMVVYPSLAVLAVKKDLGDYKKVLLKSVNVILLVMIPAAVAVAVLRYPLITVVFKRGKFDSRAVSLTAFALLFYCPSMIANGTRDMLSKAFYTVKDTKTPMINCFIGIVLNIILSIIFVKYLNVAGITFAASISAIITTIMLILNLNKRLKNIGVRKMFTAFIKILIASAAMGIALYFINNICAKHIGTNFKGSFVSLFICFISGTAVYFVFIHILKLDEYEYMTRLIKQKIKK